jgi:hypothetical protein
MIIGVEYTREEKDKKGFVASFVAHLDGFHRMSVSTLWLASVFFSGLRKTAFLRHLYIKTIILPRQAWDKHRENSKKDVPFSAPINHRHRKPLPACEVFHLCFFREETSLLFQLFISYFAFGPEPVLANFHHFQD